MSSDLSAPQARSDLASLSATSRAVAAAVLPRRIATQIAGEASTTDTLRGFQRLLEATSKPIDADDHHLPDDLKAEVLAEVFKIIEMIPLRDMAEAFELAVAAGKQLPAEFRAGPARELAKSVSLIPRHRRLEAFELTSEFINGIVPPANRAEPMVELFSQIRAMTEIEETIEAISSAMNSVAHIPPNRLCEPLPELLKQFGLVNEDAYLPIAIERAIAFVDSMPARDRPTCLHGLSVASSFIEDPVIASRTRDRIIECMNRFADDSGAHRP